MNDEKLFQLVRDADPLPATFGYGQSPPSALLERVLAAARVQEPARQHRRRSRIIVAAAVIALGAAFVGFAVAGTGWLSGGPAPPAVVTNFEAYTPQLGFHPNPHSAVRVAQDGDISLFATTNQEGTYCLDVTAPWKSPQVLDGGMCLPSAIASTHLIAGVLDASSANQPEGHWTLVVAGRTDNPMARAIRFTAPDGGLIDRTLGSSGFFIAGIPIRTPPCAGGNWSSTFTALGANGNELAQAKIPLLVKAVEGGHAWCHLGM